VGIQGQHRCGPIDTKPTWPEPRQIHTRQARLAEDHIRRARSSIADIRVAATDDHVGDTVPIDIPRRRNRVSVEIRAVRGTIDHQVRLRQQIYRGCLRRRGNDAQEHHTRRDEKRNGPAGYQRLGRDLLTPLHDFSVQGGRSKRSSIRWRSRSLTCGRTTTSGGHTPRSGCAPGPCRRRVSHQQQVDLGS